MGLGTTAGMALAGPTGGISLPVGIGVDALGALIKGVSQSQQGKKSGKDADALQPPLYDPQSQAFLAEINQKRKSINSGSSYAADMGAIDAGTAGTQQAIVEASGGDTAGTIQGLLASQNVANRAKNQVLANSDAMRHSNDVFAGELTKAMTARAMQLQLAQQAQKRAVWAQKKQDSMPNILGGLARMGDGSGNLPKIDFGDILARHGASATPIAGMNPEQQAMKLQPDMPILEEGDAESMDPGLAGLPSFDFSQFGTGNTGGIPTF